MNAIKTMAIIYESKNESLCHKAIKSLMIDIHYFTLVPIEAGHDASYALWKDSEFSKNLELKLMAAHSFFIINPKGAIMPCVSDILSYAELHNKTVHYMFKYCYPDCEHLKGLKSCQNIGPVMWIPSHHKLLPACEVYSRVYDRVVVRPDPPQLIEGVDDQGEKVIIFGDSPLPKELKSNATLGVKSK